MSRLLQKLLHNADLLQDEMPGDGGAGGGAEGGQGDGEPSGGDGSNGGDGGQEGGDGAHGAEGGQEGSDGGEGGEGGDGGELGAPEAYADFTLPEGVTLPETRLGQLHEFAKANNWTQDQAQAAVDLYTELQTEDLQAREQSWVDQEAIWHDELKTDAVLARGGKFEENLGEAAGMLDKLQGMLAEDFGAEAGDIKDMMNKTRMGNNPLMVRVMYSLSKRFGEDGIVTAKGGGKHTASREEIMYPNS